jgi:hypothetical protein
MTIENLDVSGWKPKKLSQGGFAYPYSTYETSHKFRFYDVNEDGIQLSSEKTGPSKISIPEGATITHSEDSVVCRRIRKEKGVYEIGTGPFDLFIRTRKRITFHLTGINLNESLSKGRDIGITRRKI